MTTYYKWTHSGRRSVHGVTDYPPVGEWSESRRTVLCESGWHVPHPDHLAEWMTGELWEVEVQGANVMGVDKSAHERIRFIRPLPWTAKDVADFAATCAAHAAASAHDAAHDAAYAHNAVHAAARDAAAHAAAGAARAAAGHAYGHAYGGAGGGAAYGAFDAARAEQSAWIRNRVQENLDRAQQEAGKDASIHPAPQEGN